MSLFLRPEWPHRKACLSKEICSVFVVDVTVAVSISMYKMYTNKQPHIFWLIILILYSRVFLIKAWDAEELSLFDLVEEINQNFYELFGVDQVLNLER